MPDTTLKENYIVYKIEGLNNCKLQNVVKLNFDDSIFEQVEISSNLKEIKLYFDSEEDTNNIIEKANTVLFEIFKRLILNKEIDISIPEYNVDVVRIGNEDITQLQINERIAIRDEFRMQRSFDAKVFLEEVLSGNNLVTDANKLLYRKLLSIMRNPEE
ncbi:hypothetical protein SAMN05880501_101133 [Ureibacillus xyleni]|uniref:Uncharacterized protein n=1 Tax=Ureibacillus xyleni TaxID=614648 RepID=A0A285RD01_9BACL|nr:hypothetical protein [Ureibacillus xyleni]SOB90282.1 hypothetical protein SAMN05880501_101133 [Ureibacillus xyleni]